MGLITHRLQRFVCEKTVAKTDDIGGVFRQESGDSLPFWGLLLPPKKQIARAENGVRLAMTWQVLALGFPDIKEGDWVRLEDQPPRFVVTGLKRWPRHLCLNLERLE